MLGTTWSRKQLTVKMYNKVKRKNPVNNLSFCYPLDTQKITKNLSMGRRLGFVFGGLFGGFFWSFLLLLFLLFSFVLLNLWKHFKIYKIWRHKWSLVYFAVTKFLLKDSPFVAANVWNWMSCQCGYDYSFDCF